MIMNVNDGTIRQVELTPSGTVPVPYNYVMCDGGTYKAKRLPNLYSIIGTKYGTSGSGTFNVPDLRGRIAQPQIEIDGVKYTWAELGQATQPDGW